jgi:hypothetical protein
MFTSQWRSGLHHSSIFYISDESQIMGGLLACKNEARWIFLKEGYYDSNSKIQNTIH